MLPASGWGPSLASHDASNNALQSRDARPLNFRIGFKLRRPPMAGEHHPFDGSHLARIEPSDRLVILARTIQARDPGTSNSSTASLTGRALEKHASGIALYRHRLGSRTLRCAVEPSRTELLSRHRSCRRRRSRARGQAATAGDPTAARGDLRPPPAFVPPRNWQGSGDRSERQ